MKTEYTVLAKFRNKEAAGFLIDEIRKRGHTCYSFIDSPSDPNNPDGNPEEQMKVFESTDDFYNNTHFREIFQKDLEGLKNAEKVIVLLPAGSAVHIEAGIAFGLGKKLILIGEAEKPETLYLIFQERYKSIEDFLETLSIF